LPVLTFTYLSSIRYGRAPIYFVGFFCFLAFSGGAAAAQNIETLLICRFFAGAGGAAFLSVAGGTVVDVFRPAEVSFLFLLQTTFVMFSEDILYRRMR
jgi:MFS family permease